MSLHRTPVLSSRAPRITHNLLCYCVSSCFVNLTELGIIDRKCFQLFLTLKKKKIEHQYRLCSPGQRKRGSHRANLGPVLLNHLPSICSVDVGGETNRTNISGSTNIRRKFFTITTPISHRTEIFFLSFQGTFSVGPTQTVLVHSLKVFAV